MNYETYWSILDAPTNSIKPYNVCLLISIISIILLILIKIYKNSSVDGEKKIMLISVASFFAVSTLAFIYLKYFVVDNTEKRIETYLQSSNVSQVEGIISDYKREEIHVRNGKTTYENFKVDSVYFKYYDNALYEFSQFGGNRTEIFHNGLKVKITYSKKDNKIVKIEIAKEN